MSDSKESYADVVKEKSLDELQKNLEELTHEQDQAKKDQEEAHKQFIDSREVYRDFKGKIRMMCVEMVEFIFKGFEFKVPNFQEVSETSKGFKETMKEFQNKENKISLIVEQLEHKKTIIIHHIEFFNRKKFEIMNARIIEENSAIQGCPICQEACKIPVRLVFFECNHVGDNGRIKCRVYMCLDCARQFFQLNKSCRKRTPVSCPHYRTIHSQLPLNARSCYQIDEMVMEIIDEYFKKYSNGESLIECVKCGQWFKNARDLWKHKRGEGVPPCLKSTRVCKECEIC